jgi:hypothetical protein
VTPERFRQIEEAFQHARDLAPAEQAAYLDRLRDDDLDLHDEVTSLLESEPDAPDALRRTIAGPLRALSRSPRDTM